MNRRGSEIRLLQRRLKPAGFGHAPCDRHVGIDANSRKEFLQHFQRAVLLFPVICPAGAVTPELSLWQHLTIGNTGGDFSCYLQEAGGQVGRQRRRPRLGRRARPSIVAPARQSRGSVILHDVWVAEKPVELRRPRAGCYNLSHPDGPMPPPDAQRVASFPGTYVK